MANAPRGSDGIEQHAERTGATKARERVEPDGRRHRLTVLGFFVDDHHGGPSRRHGVRHGDDPRRRHPGRRSDLVGRVLGHDLRSCLQKPMPIFDRRSLPPLT